jgi:hypothetical protein
MIRQFAIDSNISMKTRQISHNYQARFGEYYDNDIINNSVDKTEYEIYLETSAAFFASIACCPKCHSQGVLKDFGVYERCLVACISGKKFWRRMEVKRVLCCCCKKTHAILPDTVIPHMQHSILFVLGVIWEYEHRSETGKTVARICEECSISTSILYIWKKRFEMHSSLEQGAIKTKAEIDARYWPPNGAVMSGVTKEFFCRQGFSLMQFVKASATTQSAATQKRVATAGSISHKIGIDSGKAIDYPVIVSKTIKTEVIYGKSEGPVPNGTVQVRADCANNPENIPGRVGVGILQESGDITVGTAGRGGADLRPENDIKMGGTLHVRRAGRIDQAAPQGQRRHACTGHGRDVEDMRHQIAIPETAVDTS